MAIRPPSRPTAPAEVLDNLNLGYNGYTDPTLCNPKMWALASNVFSGAFGYIERARFAMVVNFTPPTGSPYTSLNFASFTDVPGNYLLGDLAGKLYSYDLGLGFNYSQVQRINPYVDPAGVGSSKLNGPFSRQELQNIAYEMNGQVKQTGRGANASIIEGWGLDAPDSTLQLLIASAQFQAISSITRSNSVVTITLTAAVFWPSVGEIVNVTGVTDTSFNGSFVLTGGSGATWTYSQIGQNATSSGGTMNRRITKTIGRSYAYAWENANKGHIGAPSPATQYFQYNNQFASQIDALEPGLASATSGSPVITGTGTFFTSAWIGRHLWLDGFADRGRIIAVASPTQLTLDTNQPNIIAGTFQVFDPQATHLRLYATADGGATYFRIARNAFDPTATNAVAAGLEFQDMANSEPPDFPFTTETAQDNNVPPPIGRYTAGYQGRIVVFGVPGVGQSFFYSNQETTTIGLPQESFAPLNQVTLPLANANISGWIEFPGAAVIFSDRQDMFRLTGLLTDNTVEGVAQDNAAAQQGAEITRLPYNIGCATPFATAITPLGGFWLSPNAEIWLFTDAYAPRNIGKPIQDILSSADLGKLSSARMKYYHRDNRNWLVLAFPSNAQPHNDKLLILDLDLLASNGAPSYYAFDMASNSPSWWVYDLRADCLEMVFDGSSPTASGGGYTRIHAGAIDTITDVDYHGGFGTELTVDASVETHPWGNDSAFSIKRPGWFRFNTNRDPAMLADDGWSFEVQGIDDDFYTLFDPLRLPLVPGVNDTSTLGGNPDLLGGSPYRHSPELYRIGGINFMAGRRLKFKVTFPTSTGLTYRIRNIQIGFGAEVPN